MKKVVFVCTGNTCRSPMAEGFLKAMLESDKIDSVIVTSGGISVVSSYPASDNAIAAMREKGIDISNHRSRHVDQVVDGADLIYCMSESHASILRLMFPEKAAQICTLSDKDIPDPYGGGIEEYRAARESIEKAVKAIYKKVVANER